MSEQDAPSVSVKGLEALSKALKKKPPRARVGILGSGAARTGGGLTNAEIGAWHEYGTSRVPKRSFLREPLTDLLGKRISDEGLFDKEQMDEVLKTKSILPWMKVVTVVAEGIVIEAFGTGGYGNWAPWKDGYTSKTGMILDDTGQLKRSITSEVTE